MPASDQILTVPYKFLVCGLFAVFVGLVVARIVVPFAVPSPSPAVTELVRDLWTAAQSLLAALVGLLAGKATR